MKRIAVVDDDEQIIRAVTLLWKPHGHVDGFTDSTRFLRAAWLGATWDAILVDWTLNECHGDSVIDALRMSFPAMAERAALFTSALLPRRVLDRYRVIDKPFALADLLALVEGS